MSIFLSHKNPNSLTRKVLIEKNRTYQLIKFGQVLDAGCEYVDNFIMPESLYVMEDAPEFSSPQMTEKIIAIANIVKRKDGYYAQTIMSLKGFVGKSYIDMLYRGQLTIHLASTGRIKEGIVENCVPFCLYLKLSQ